VIAHTRRHGCRHCTRAGPTRPRPSPGPALSRHGGHCRARRISWCGGSQSVASQAAVRNRGTLSCLPRLAEAHGGVPQVNDPGRAAGSCDRAGPRHRGTQTASSRDASPSPCSPSSLLAQRFLSSWCSEPNNRPIDGTRMCLAERLTAPRTVAAHPGVEVLPTGTGILNRARRANFPEGAVPPLVADATPGR
jgi:hypothetical protein